MKKLSVLVLLLACVLALGGCGRNAAQSAETPAEMPAAEATGAAAEEKGPETVPEAEPVPAGPALREDRCALYLQVLEDLWEVDPGLNSGIVTLGIDLSGLTHLDGAEREKVAADFAARHGLPYIEGTWEELCDAGHIDREHLIWEEGLFFCIKTNEEAAWDLPAVGEGGEPPELTAFDAHKWRSGLGAYFFGRCSAQKNADGAWTYSVEYEAIA